jgi:hypothetical protein
VADKEISDMADISAKPSSELATQDLTG